MFRFPALRIALAALAVVALLGAVRARRAEPGDDPPPAPRPRPVEGRVMLAFCLLEFPFHQAGEFVGHRTGADRAVSACRDG